MLARGDGRLLAMFRIPEIRAGYHMYAHMPRAALSSFGSLPVIVPLLRS